MVPRPPSPASIAATDAPVFPTPCTRNALPATGPPTAWRTAATTPWVVARPASTAASTYGENPASTRMSASVVFMSQPVYSLPPWLLRTSPTARGSAPRSTVVGSALAVSFAPENPVA